MIKVLEQINHNSDYILKVEKGRCNLYKNNALLAQCIPIDGVFTYYKDFVNKNFKNKNFDDYVTIMDFLSLSIGAGFILMKNVIKHYKKNKKYIITATSTKNLSAINTFKKLGFLMLDNLRENTVLFYFKLND